MKFLITGVTGFIGKHVADICHDYRGVVRQDKYHLYEDAIVVDSIDEKTDWTGCFEGIDAILHLAGVAHRAGSSDQDYSTVNTQGTLHLAREAVKAGVKRFVFVSSIGVNGTSTFDTRYSHHTPAFPHNDYALSKYNAELGLKKIAQDSGLEVVIVRPTLVYGSNAPGNFGILTRLVEKLPILPFGAATNRRDFIAVQNLADLLVTCAVHENAAGQTFLASDSETVSIRAFTDAIAKGLDKKVIQLPIPVSLTRLVGKLTGKSAMVEQLFGNLEVDSSNIKQVLGWTPPVTMEQAMATLREPRK